jgi:hypothetical protein
MVDGKGEGFGNIISIQIVAIVRAARAVRHVHSLDEGRPVCLLHTKRLTTRFVGLKLIFALLQTWPVCHVLDNTSLYLDLIRAILEGRNPGSGKHGYYLAASGSVVWLDLYQAVAEALFKRKIVDDAAVTPANDEALGEMATALGYPKEMVAWAMGGM